MKGFLVLLCFLVTVSMSLEIYNDPSTAFNSCQDALTRDPLAETGFYYITNFGEVEPYMTLCYMSMNRGGWTLFYKNSLEEEEGSSYSDLLEDPQPFIMEGIDVFDPSVVGLSPIAGFKARSIMAIPALASNQAFSAIDFGDEEVAESIINLSDFVEGCNSFDDKFTLSYKDEDDYTFSSIKFSEGVFDFYSCNGEVNAPHNTAWLGDVYSNDTRRVLSCGGIAGTHCMYFIREYVNIHDPFEECMCRASGIANMVWPATKCGETRTIGCFEGTSNGLLHRQCGELGQWNDYIHGNCSCSAVFEFGTNWPQTQAGEQAHVACENDNTKTRDRICLPNGEWDDFVTGGCTCNAEMFEGVQWEDTEGGNVAQHICEMGAAGTPYTRDCSVSGIWSDVVDGGCDCPVYVDQGFIWPQSAHGVHIAFNCSSASVGTLVERTCGIYGIWNPIEGNCDCGEEKQYDILWPRTQSGTPAYYHCDDNAVGTPYIRVCTAGGTWGDYFMGSCSCPSEDWVNYAGTHYSFPQTEAGAVTTLPCVHTDNENITRRCGPYGSWEYPQGCYEAVYCPADTYKDIHFNDTLGGTTVVVMCAGNSSKSYGRVCEERGVWEPVVGFCECPAFTDEEGLYWPKIPSETSHHQQCGEGYKGSITRGCSFFGSWFEKQNSCIRNRCSAEEGPYVEWPESNSITTVSVSCRGSIGSGYNRYCDAEGIWSSIVIGNCKCSAEYKDGKYYPVTNALEKVYSSCPSGYTGTKYRLCNGYGMWEEIVNECVPLSCPGEIFGDVEWPTTLAGYSATAGCVSTDTATMSRYCYPTGYWSETINGKGCYCDSTVIQGDNSVYIWPKTESGLTITKACAALYQGTISYTCGRNGAWKDLDNQCHRIQCATNTYEGKIFPATDSNTTVHLNCIAGSEGPGFDRFCDASGQWSSTVEGNCYCPAETVRHRDGHLYKFEKTEGGELVTQVCAGDLAGSISRSCNNYGLWQNIEGQCKTLQCPEDVVNGYVYPVTNSSSEVRLPCKNYMNGYMKRYCYPAGLWGEPENLCEEVQCNGIYINRVEKGCLNILFDENTISTWMRVHVVPSKSPDNVIINRGRTLRLCDLEANIPYNLFVQYCDDGEDESTCTSSCLKQDIYYQQTCDVMPLLDIVGVQQSATSTTLTFSSQFVSCPTNPSGLEITYQCTSGCADMEEHKLTTPCSELNGCAYGTRGSVSVEDDFVSDATYVIKQRLLTEEQLSGVQPYSQERSFTINSLLRQTRIRPIATAINSRTVFLDLGAINHANVVFKKHIIYIYKKEIGTRRLIDSYFSTIKLCDTGRDEVCDVTSTTIVVEPGYDYSFSIYSYPVISEARIVISTTMITIQRQPTFTMTAVAGDSFITLQLDEAIYDLSGYCSFVGTKIATSRSVIYVTLPKNTKVYATASGLIANSEYSVSCVLLDSANVEGRVVTTRSTLPVYAPALSLIYVTDSTYDVSLNAITNKPTQLYCVLGDETYVPSESELILTGKQFEIATANQAMMISMVLEEERSTSYRVTCLASDTYNRKVVEYIIVTPTGTPFAPKIISTVPVNGTMDVSPFVQMKLVFEYPIEINTCQFCFFILYDVNAHTTTNIYSSEYEVVDNYILFNTMRLHSLTTYYLKPSVGELIRDKATKTVYVPSSTVWLSFKVKSYSEINGRVVYPKSGEFFAVNGVIEVEYDNYVFINEGEITLNSIVIDAKDKCLQLKHLTGSTTTLYIPVAECTGILRSQSSYVMVIPQGFVINKDQILSTTLTHIFETEANSYSPKAIGSFPPNLEDMVPLDVSIKIYFDQPVVAGDGYLFVNEYHEDKYVNSFNLPATKAKFSNSYPYEVAWSSRLYTLHPNHNYVVSWSKNLVMNAYHQGVEASSAQESWRFWTAEQSCSPDYIADRIQDSLVCTYEDDVCHCSTDSVMAMTQKKH